MQTKSHETLLKILNNIGIIGSVLAAVVDIILVVVFVLGINIKQNMTSTIIFSIINALIGILINFLLRYQGQKYAEIENEELCKKFYEDKVKKEKRHIPISVYNALLVIKDILIKGCTTTFSIFGLIYISIEGSKNPIQILMTFATLVMFACFGLMNMNSSYCRFYNKQVPYMEYQLELRKNKIKGDNGNGTL